MSLSGPGRVILDKPRVRSQLYRVTKVEPEKVREVLRRNKRGYLRSVTKITVFYLFTYKGVHTSVDVHSSPALNPRCDALMILSSTLYRIIKNIATETTQN